MNKTILALGLVLVALVGVGAVAAYGGFGLVSGEHHEDVESILESGSYADLVEYREKSGYPVMNRVQSEEDFELMKERHQYMEENGYEPGQFRGTGEGLFAGQGKRMKGQGMHGGQELRGKGAGLGGCPYMNQ